MPNPVTLIDVAIAAYVRTYVEKMDLFEAFKFSLKWCLPTLSSRLPSPKNVEKNRKIASSFGKIIYVLWNLLFKVFMFVKCFLGWFERAVSLMICSKETHKKFVRNRRIKSLFETDAFKICSKILSLITWTSFFTNNLFERDALKICSKNTFSDDLKELFH
jgi:hypothetical protein